MILTDTGPLVAILDAGDPNHGVCAKLVHTLQSPLLTTWPCFTEAMYLLFRAGGHRGQQLLWNLCRSGTIVLHDMSAADLERMEFLMASYKDTPMDMADASLVVTAETLNLTRIFSLDAHFHAFRINARDAFLVAP